MSRRPVPRLWLAVGGLIAASLAALAAYRHEARPEWSPVARGARLAEASGCFACHGRAESEHRTNARRLASGAWRPRGIPTLWENGIDEAEVLATWIAQGCPPDERARHEQLLIQMPAYAPAHLAPDEIDAIAAWILAEGIQRMRGDGGPAAPLPEDPAQVAALDADALYRHGDRLSRQHGCYQCHGELGQGGVPNPSSFKAYIPGFFGRDFLALTDGGDRDEILHWIEHGRGRVIERGPLGALARRFFDRQAIGMPAYRDRLSAVEKTILTEHVRHLNARGPLPAKAVEADARRLMESPP